MAAALALGLLSLAFGACGGDDQTAAELDEAYAVAICDAYKTYTSDTMELRRALFWDGRLTPEKMAKLAPLLEEYAAALYRATPPKDVEAYHRRYVAYWNKLAAAWRNPEAVADPFLGADAESAGRLQPWPGAFLERMYVIMVTNPACEGLNVPDMFAS